MFSCEFYKTSFLENTSRQLLLQNASSILLLNVFVMFANEELIVCKSIK